MEVYELATIESNWQTATLRARTNIDKLIGEIVSTQKEETERMSSLQAQLLEEMAKAGELEAQAKDLEARTVNFLLRHKILICEKK